MSGAGARIRGGAFVLVFYALMAVWGLAGAPVVLWRESWARAWMKAHNRLAFALLRLICGIRIEVRGGIPSGTVVVAPKHQSLLDVLVLFTVLPEARFVMKRELLRAPVFGLYARRAGALPIDRSGGAGAFRWLAEALGTTGGQAVVYPQGTRVAPGERRPYRKGAAALAATLGRPLVPVATNAGHFWPRRGIERRPGIAVVEFLAPLPAEGDVDDLTARLAARIDAASDALALEACGRGPA